MLRLISDFTCLGIIGLLGLAVTAQAAAPDVVHGKTIAKRWCAACHQVAPDQTPVNLDVPSFASVGRQEKLTPKVLTAFLSTPHPRMPDMNLTRGEIADVAAYIKSLDR